MASSAHSISFIPSSPRHGRYPPQFKKLWSCSMSMKGSSCRSSQVEICRTQRLPTVSAPEHAISELKLAVSALESDPPHFETGIIRVEVPLRQKIDAIDWLHAQKLGSLCRLYFASRDRRDFGGGASGNGGIAVGIGVGEEEELVSVAGIGSAVFFRGDDRPFGFDDWRSIKRFLSKDCPFIRAYGAIRFDATTDASSEWKDFGSHFFTVPQVEFDEFQESSRLALTIAWDNNILWTWKKAVEELKATLYQITPCFSQLRMPQLRSTVVSSQHFPSKEYWYSSVERALQMIRGSNSDLEKVVLARCSKYTTDTLVDPLVLLSCLKEESRSSYQFCIQPPEAASFIGNTPEQLFHRKSSIVASEALAGTRARGQTYLEDLRIGQDLLLSHKDGNEFAVVRDNIRRKLETVCGEVLIEPTKALRKLPRVQHLSAKLSGKLRDEDDEFEVLMSLHPTPAVCGMPSEDARKFIQDCELFDRGMYAGPVGWFGARESEFAVGIRSALVAKDCSTLIYAGAGIVEGADPFLEWDELNLKASQFTRLLQSHEHCVCYQETQGTRTAS